MSNLVGEVDGNRRRPAAARDAGNGKDAAGSDRLLGSVPQPERLMRDEVGQRPRASIR